jgi:hypothetical protein
MQCEGVGEGWVRAPLPATPPHTERLAIESQSLRTRTISVGRDEDEIAPPLPPSSQDRCVSGACCSFVDEYTRGIGRRWRSCSSTVRIKSLTHSSRRRKRSSSTSTHRSPRFARICVDTTARALRSGSLALHSVLCGRRRKRTTALSSMHTTRGRKSLSTCGKVAAVPRE